MSGAVKNEPRAPGGCHGCETIHVAVKSVTESKDFAVRGDCTVRQLKLGLSERLGASAEQLVLIHSGRVLKESELLSHLKGQDKSVSLCMIRRVSVISPPRPHHSPAAPNSDSSEMVQSELTAVLTANTNNLTPSPTSPLCLVEGLGSLGLTDSGPGFFPDLQCQMERQLLSDSEMMRCVLGSPFVQSTLSTSSPQVIRHLILSNPQIQQLLETKPEVGDMLNNSDVITQVLELLRSPDMIKEMIHNEDAALDNLQSEHNNPETITAESDDHQKTQAKIPEDTINISQAGGRGQQTPAGERDQTPPFSSMQSLLEDIMASPGLMENLLSGPYINTLLNCLGQNPELAAQMLLSHPLFSGNPQLQQQMRQQLPLLLQQMQSPEMVSALLNPRAMEAVLQIQQGLQVLVAEAPALIPVAELVNTGTSVNAVPDCVLSSQSGNSSQVATVTEQQQQFVQQMLQALANTNNGKTDGFPGVPTGAGASELNGLQR
ncbi:ubiquilin-1-like isoform X2 [Mastacembelus armatus]|uniref:ubiquilin-1-like isoform X2 n=1 Tax=Mastacembelus armatus TaxID=205130 RepID=UPI000E464912|nr:ubiquilin-1 isoform X2 [Mastacembelus armatus]